MGGINLKKGASPMVRWVKNLPSLQETKETLGSIPGSRRSSGEGNGSPLQYSCLENPHGQGSLEGYGHRVPKSQT